MYVYVYVYVCVCVCVCVCVRVCVCVCVCVCVYIYIYIYIYIYMYVCYIKWGSTRTFTALLASGPAPGCYNWGGYFNPMRGGGILVCAITKQTRHLRA